MASEREAAKNAITERDSDDPALDQTLSTAHLLQLELARETNRHNEAMRKSELGFFGKFIGGEATAPVVIALFVVVVGLLIAAGCLYGAGHYPAQAPLYDKYTERGISLALAALAYIFGKGGK